MEHTPTSRPERRVVTDPKSVALLLDESERIYLSYFFGPPRTVSHVANELGEHRSKVLYRVRKLHRGGLLRIASLQQRAGRPIKYYQTSARHFIVPYAASPSTNAQEFIGLLEGTLRDAFYESFLPEEEAHTIGVEFSGANREGIVNMRFASRSKNGWREAGPSRSDTDLLHINLLALSKADAISLRQELLALLERYQEREVEGAQYYLLRLGLTRKRVDR